MNRYSIFAAFGVIALTLIVELQSYSIPDDYNGTPIIFDGYVGNVTTYVSMFTPAKDRNIVEGDYKEIGDKLIDVVRTNRQGKHLN